MSDEAYSSSYQVIPPGTRTPENTSENDVLEELGAYAFSPLKRLAYEKPSLPSVFESVFHVTPWQMAIILLVTAIVFVLLFSGAHQLQAFGQSSGIAPTVNEWLGLGPGGLP
jgi:hypothetical protein